MSNNIILNDLGYIKIYSIVLYNLIRNTYYVLIKYL